MALAPNDMGGTENRNAIRLVTAHRSGDATAFSEIVRTHYATLLACARRRLMSQQDAEDAVQEAFLRAYRRLETFGNGGDWRLGAWLNTILSNVCSDILVRRRPSAPFEEWADGRADDGPDAVELVSDHLVLQAVADAIACLPESQRSAFLLRMVDDRTYEEVAAALGISEDNARARVARARSALQRALSRCEALTGVLAAAPLLVAGSLRSGLRRVFSSNADSAHATAASAMAASAPGAAAEAASVTNGPLGSGMQLLNQLASTPVAQTALAASASGGARGSVVLGVVASLAAAGTLSVPAIAVASSSPSAAVQPAPHLTSVTTSTAPGANATSTPPTQVPAAVAAASTTPSPISSAPPAPSWVAVAASAAVNGRAAVASDGSTKAASTGGSSTPATTTPGTTSASTGPVLPIGTCTGVTGFAGVTAPSAVPPLSSDTLEAVMNTGPQSYTTTGGGPAFQAIGSMSAIAGSVAPVQVKVGTCLAAGGSILAVDMTGTTGTEVQLVGSLVSSPGTSASTKGAVNYLFRGQATQIAGTVLTNGRLPWNLWPSFVAEVQVQPGSKASLEVVFLQTITDTTAATKTAPSSQGTGPTTSGSARTRPSTHSGTTSSSTTPSSGTAGAGGTSSTTSTPGTTTSTASGTSGATTSAGATTTAQTASS